MDRNLHIVIVGAGMGGLASALALVKRGFTNISVFESSSNLGFVGAGIQLAPNMARILDRLGCWADVEREAVDLKDTSVRQSSTDTELAHVDLGYIRETYGYAHMVGHRSLLAGALYASCQREAGIKFHFSTSAGEIISWSPRLSLSMMPRSGTAYTVSCDILIGADGIKSRIRKQLLEKLNVESEVVDTNQAAYRIMLRREVMQHDVELRALIDGDSVTRWIGEKRHVIAYPISSKQIYNISTAQPDTHFAAAPTTSYMTKGSKSVMLSVFHDFCPTVRRMLNLVPDGEVCEWKLRVHSPLPTWVHGSMALVGDTCHPMLPHLAQGAAQAIEDAAVLAVVLDKCPDTRSESVNRALRIYEKLRKERAEMLVKLAAASGRDLHLGEGKARQERDKLFREGKDSLPDKWANSNVQQIIYGHDCTRVAEESFETLWKSFT